MEKIAVERIAKAVELFYRSLVQSLTGLIWKFMTTWYISFVYLLDIH